MRVLGKPDLEDAVRYDELELLLQNFGVPSSSEYPESEKPNTAYFCSEKKSDTHLGEESQI